MKLFGGLACVRHERQHNSPRALALGLDTCCFFGFGFPPSGAFFSSGAILPRLSPWPGHHSVLRVLEERWYGLWQDANRVATFWALVTLFSGLGRMQIGSFWTLVTLFSRLGRMQIGFSRLGRVLESAPADGR